MKKIAELKEIIAGGEFDEKLAQIYLDKDMIPYNRERYVKALDKFTELFGDQEVAIYSAPGRSEVCGNHTDHQNGHVLATSINLDAIAIVAPREDGVIELVSDDMPKEVINVNDIVGYSDGGIIALLMAMKSFKVRRFFTIGANTDPSGLTAKAVREIKTALRRANHKGDERTAALLSMMLNEPHITSRPLDHSVLYLR